MDFKIERKGMFNLMNIASKMNRICLEAMVVKPIQKLAESPLPNDFLMKHKVKFTILVITLIVKLLLILSTPYTMSKVIYFIIDEIAVPLLHGNTILNLDFSKLVIILLSIMGKKIGRILIKKIQKALIKT